VLAGLVILAAFLPSTPAPEPCAGSEQASASGNGMLWVRVMAMNGPFMVESDQGTIALRLYLRSQVGVMRWSVRDPAGQVRWEGMVPEDQLLEETRQFEAIAGRWLLQMGLQGGGGLYAYCWTAGGEQAAGSR
jgi:hypothetical protein